MIKRLFHKKYIGYWNHFNHKSIHIALGICILCFIISLIANSRAFCLGLSVSFWFLLLLKYKAPKKTFVIGLVILLSFLIIAYRLKYDSSLGRILIYKISLNILKDHYITGIGYGKFKVVYLLYQAKYFANGHFTKKELLLADNTTYLFNDYLQFMIEWGIAGMIAVFFFIVLIWDILRKALRSGSQQIVFLMSLTLIITVSIAALFNHVYDRPLIGILFFLSVNMACYFTYLLPHIRALKFYVCFSIITSCAVIYLSFGRAIFYYKTYQDFEECKKLSSAGFKEEALIKLKKIYPSLKNDHNYLYFYGLELLNNKNYRKSTQLLTITSTMISNSDLYCSIGEGFCLLGDFKKAELYYMKAIDMVPNRFGSRYSLYKLYTKTNQIRKAMSVGKDIIALPVKIQSRYINIIRASISADLHTKIHNR